MRHTLNWLIRGLVSQRPSRRRGTRNYTAPPAECLETRKNLSAVISGASIAASLATQGTVVNDPNDQMSEAMNLGSVTSSSTVSGTIDSPTDVDMFRFTATAGQRLSFDIDVTGRLDSVIRLFDSYGRQLASNDDGAAPGELRSLASYLEYTFTSGGTFYLGVSGYRNSSYNPRTGSGDTSGSKGEYELTVQSISSSPVTPAANHSQSTSSGQVTITGAAISANLVGSTSTQYGSSSMYSNSTRPSTNPIQSYVSGLQQSSLSFSLPNRYQTISVGSQPVSYWSNNTSRWQVVSNVLSQPNGYRVMASNPGLYGFSAPPASNSSASPYSSYYR